MAVNGSGIDAGKFSASHPSADTLPSCHSSGRLSFESKPGVPARRIFACPVQIDIWLWLS